MPLIEAFLEYLALEKKYSSHTVQAYKTDLLAFKDFCDIEYDAYDPQHTEYSQIRSWIVSLVNQNLSNRTINRKISSLKTFYKFLMKIEEVKVSPLVKHKSLKVESKLQIPFSKEEVRKVIEKEIDETDFVQLRDKLIIELFYSTGIRRIELINLKESDIDLTNKTIKVLGKRDKERYVPLIDSVVRTITLYLKLKTSHDFRNNYVFVTKKGTKIYETLVYGIVNSYFGEVSTKVKKSPHILRHSFATHILNEGADLNSVKELLGHSSLASTQVYTHNSLDKMKKVFNNAHPRSKKKD